VNLPNSRSNLRNGNFKNDNMIKEVTMFTVVCDNCGKDCNDGQEYSCLNDKTYALDVAMESNWEKVDDSHYCPLCYSYDDDDEIVIDKSREGAGNCL
jgi:hypothetical protein